MNNLFRSLIVLLPFISLSAAAQQKALFIILDGIPADVIEKVETPYLDSIAAIGGYTRAYVGGAVNTITASPTVSAVGYNHLLTGTWSYKHNVWDNDIKAPNYYYWNIFRIAKSVNPQLKTAVFSTWTDNRTKLAGDGLPAAGRIPIDYAYDGLELDTVRFPHDKETQYIHQIDEFVTIEAARSVETEAPDLSWVYLEFTDDMGHRYGDSPAFYEAVKQADSQVGKIWKAIKAREKKTKEKWMIVITTDHGRSATNGKGHGGQTERERTTWITTNSSTLNSHFRQQPGIIDIAPSLLNHLGIEIPDSQKAEMDGVPFTSKISISDLKAVKKNDELQLSWNTYDDHGDAEVFVATTNQFREGKEDRYVRAGKVKLSKKKYSFSIKNRPSSFYKIVVKTKTNWVNVWISE